MFFIIHRKHVFDGGSRQSWNAVSAYSQVYRTGCKELEWSIDFHYKKEAVAWCKKLGIPFMTEKEWDAEWSEALDKGVNAFHAGFTDDPYKFTADILNQKYISIQPDININLYLANSYKPYESYQSFSR